MIKSPVRRSNEKGFTIVELSIATGVYSVILLLSLVGFIQIGKLFYRGVSITRTSDVSKQALNSIKSDVSFDVITSSYMTGPGNTFPTDNIATPFKKRSYFCAGSNRYTFIQGQMLDSDAEAIEFKKPQNEVGSWKSFALLKDQVANGCPKPFDPLSKERIDPSNVTELLGDKMRLSDISIAPVALPGSNDKLYNVHIKVAYGEDSVLQNPQSTDPACVADNSTAASFCYVADLRTIVRKGL